MEATIRINTDLLTADIIDGIKKMFPHQDVEISIQPSDETEYILSKPAFAAELRARMKSIESGEPLIQVSPKDL